MPRFSDIAGNFLIISLIVLSLFALAITVQNDNDAAQPIIEEPLFNESYRGLLSNIQESSGSSRTQEGLFNSENPKPGFGSIVLFGIVSAGKTFSSMSFAFFTVVIKLPLVALGIDPNVASLLLTYLILLILVALWALYKFG